MPPPETVLSLQDEESEQMSTGADLADDRTDMILSESLQNHVGLMHEARANISNSSNVGRHASIRKFDEIGPMEAAATEVILRLGTAT